MKTLNNSERQGLQPFSKCLSRFGLSHYFKSDLDKELKMKQVEDEKKIWGFIYKFNIQNKNYIGWTINLKNRYKTHLIELKTNRHFHNSLRKYFKFGNFRIIEAFYDTKKNLKNILKKREVFWIKKLDTFDPEQKKGWNLTEGGDGVLGWEHDSQTKELIRKKAKKRYDNIKEKNKVSINSKIYWNNNPKEKEKRSKQWTGENNPKAKNVLLISPEGEKYILLTYYSFCKKYNLNNSLISAVLQGKRKHHKGWTGKYL